MIRACVIGLGGRGFGLLKGVLLKNPDIEVVAVCDLYEDRLARGVDKVKECGFTVLTGEGKTPYFDEAELVLVCLKHFVQQMDPENIPAEICDSVYPTKDYHYIYIGEIMEALVKE